MNDYLFSIPIRTVQILRVRADSIEEAMNKLKDGEFGISEVIPKYEVKDFLREPTEEDCVAVR